MTMMKRASLSCSGKDVKVFIFSAGCAVPASLRRSTIAGYAAKESVPPWLPHASANVEADRGGPCPCSDSGGRGGREGGFAVPYLVCPWVGSTGGRGLGGGTSGSGTWPVPTCSHIIASSSSAVVVGMCGAVGCVGAGGAVGSLAVLAAARPWRI